MCKDVRASAESDRLDIPAVVGDSAEDALVRQGLELLAAFRSIANEDIRRCLVTMARALAGPDAA